MTADLPSPSLHTGGLVAGRFELGEKLGEGGMGVVYSAYDRKRATEVALKTLRIRDAEFLYLIKREFRTLTDLSHPNLVTLHELVVDDELAFLTMERVKGQHWLEWVRKDGNLDRGRLENGLIQLVRALHHLHRHGLVHRDVKPTNVMVTAEGRLKLLDFGLALAARSRPDPSDSFVVGTLDYLSPEQARGQPVTAASDFFGVGVMLYEAMTGRTPWPDADARALLEQRVSAEPALAFGHDDERGVLGSLDLLCLDLRLPDPDLRPGSTEVLRRLGAPELDGTSATRNTFVGRTVERSRLATAVDGGLHGNTPRLLLVRGQSGTGKSAMSRALLNAHEHAHHALILRGQCYERETVRYSGVDAVVDTLRAYLLELDPEDLERLLPGRSAALAVAFPVVEDLIAPTANELPTDPLELQRAASDAFRDLIVALSKTQPVLLFIDDLHWCSDETTRLLLHLLQAPPDSGFVVLGTYRADMLERSTSLASLRGESLRRDNLWELDLAPLPYEEACRLAATQLGLPAPDAICDEIARESGGNPLFVEELARHAADTEAVRGAGRLGLEAMTQSRVHGLPNTARDLLSILAIAGGPLTQRVAIEASSSPTDANEGLAELRAQHFVRTFGPGPDDVFEVLHGRVRLAVLQLLSEEQRAEHHLALATTLERADADPESLAFHFARCGRTDAAVTYLRQAARLASGALAFRRAADLAQQALDLLQPAETSTLRAPLEAELGEALSNDGHGAEAAEAYLRAAAASRDDAVELRRRAAEQYLRSGHAAEGLPLLTEVLEAVGLGLARNSKRAIGSWLLQRASIALTGTEFTPQPEVELDARALLRVDICWTAATGLPAVDVFLGQDMQAKHLRLALQLGEPRRVARALSLEILYGATSGTRNLERVNTLIDRVGDIAQSVGSPHIHGLLALASGAACVYRGEFSESIAFLRRADDTFRNQCTGAAWELSFTNTFDILARLYRGDFARLVTTLEVTTEDARARDDLFTMLMVRIGYDYLRHIIADQPDRARAQLEAAQAWRPEEAANPTFRFTMLMALGRIERYAGRHARAYACFVEHHAAVRKSMMLTKQPFVLYFCFERGSGALWAAHAAYGAERERLLAVAQKDCAKIRAEKTRWGAVFVGLLEGSLFAARGEDELARQSLEAARVEAQACEMRLYAASARIRRDELDANPAPDFDEFEAEGIDAPARMVNMHAPPVRDW
ncbi:MAG: protein kinase domain-containing protein [Nannocystales bacterium]